MKRFVVVFAVAALMFGPQYASYAQSRDFKLGKGLEIEYAVLRELAASYVDTVDFEKMLVKGVQEMLATLDPYTVYITEDEEEDFELMTTGNYGGVGAIIRKLPGEGVKIIEPYEGSPASKFGLQPGDVIVEIDGMPVFDETSQQSSDRMKGQPGTEVRFKVVKGRTKDTVNITVVRERIHVSDLTYAGMYQDSVGYISISGFTDKLSSEVRGAMTALKQAGAKQMILDLRGNGGGVMEEAIKMVSLFVPKGTMVVSSKGRDGADERKYFSADAPVDTVMPLLVMVNGESASASEITAGAIKDLGRGTIAGTRTFGKGLIQSIRPMPYSTRMKLTTGRYYTPSGRCVQAIDYSKRHEDGTVERDADGGIAPDIEVESKAYSRPMVSLIYNDILGSYAIEYFKAHESIPAPEDFHLTDKEYEDFVAYASEQDFDARSSAQTALDALIKAAKQEDLYDLYKDEIEALSAKVNMDKTQMLKAKKDEIKGVLETEIATCYYFARASVPVSFRYDVQLREAVRLWQEKLTGEAPMQASAPMHP